MAPRDTGSYHSPKLPFQINVEETSLLLDAAVRAGVKRVVLISSIAVVQRAVTAGEFLSADLPPGLNSIYGLTKVLQEETARYNHAQHGLQIVILRPAYICMGDTLEDNYGIRHPRVNWQFIHPRDIGVACARCVHPWESRVRSIFFDGWSRCRTEGRYRPPHVSAWLGTTIPIH